MKNIQIYTTQSEASFVSGLKPALKDCRAWHTTVTPLTLLQLKKDLDEKQIDAIICSNPVILQKILKNPAASLHDYAGSILELHGREVVILAPLTLWHKVPEYPHLAKRFVSKVTQPEKWMNIPKISWEIATPNRHKALAELFDSAILIAVDIETVGLVITEVGFCGLFIQDGKYVAHSIVVPLEDNSSYGLIKRIAENPVAKVMQNGSYDASYFLMWRIAVRNWSMDTYHFMHSWMAELDKNLGFIAAYCIRNFVYWKEEKNSGNQNDKYFYNAKDTWTTLWSAVAMLLDAPDWAFKNFTRHEFRLVFPCLSCGMEGIKIDEEEREKLRVGFTKQAEDARARLDVILGTKGFNPNSPKQVVQVFQAFGGPKFTSSDKKSMASFKDIHPLNSIIVDLVKSARAGTKLVSTYVNAKMLNGRLHYKIDPAGTDSGRLASKKSHFGVVEINTKGDPKWVQYGAQIQNFTGKVKSMCVADDGWELAEIDNSQSESRCTAYISEDLNLIHTVEHSPDFHCTNASLFFGIPFEELYDVARKKKLNEDLRNLAKRVNHGANYNMGPQVLLETMGLSNVLKAQILLKLPRKMGPLEVCAYLLSCFDKAYPLIKGKYYKEVIQEIHETGMLVGATGWTRLCFRDPAESKMALNAYVAHPPQSLSVMMMNEAFFKVWLEFQLIQGRIRFKAQIHDSLFFQYRPSDLTICQEVSDMMKIPVTIRGRTMVIPNDIGNGKHRWSELK